MENFYAGVQLQIELYIFSNIFKNNSFKAQINLKKTNKHGIQYRQYTFETTIKITDI